MKTKPIVSEDQPRIYFDDGTVLVADELLVGFEHGFYIDNINIVSPALFQLLQEDDSVRETIANQLNFYDLKSIVENEVHKIKHEELVYEETN